MIDWSEETTYIITSLVNHFSHLSYILHSITGICYHYKDHKSVNTYHNLIRLQRYCCPSERVLGVCECCLESSLNVSDEGGDLGGIRIDLWLAVASSVCSQVLSFLLGLRAKIS